MKTLTRIFVILALGALFCPVRVDAADLVKARNGSGVYGYKDTPKLPWCEWLVHDPDRPAPPKVSPGPFAGSPTAPADAVVLFNGKDVSQWTDTTYEVKDGLLIAMGDRSPQSRQEFGSFQLHLEWRAPANFEGPWYNKGNNGVMLHGLYEIQIFDSYNEPIYPDGQCAAIYGQTPPLVNATRPPGEWQSFDIVFIAPKFDGNKVSAPARVTVFHNGLLAQHDEVIHGSTGHRILPSYEKAPAKGPIALGGHGCPIAFRNIWVRSLDKITN